MVRSSSIRLKISSAFLFVLPKQIGRLKCHLGHIDHINFLLLWRLHIHSHYFLSIVATYTLTRAGAFHVLGVALTVLLVATYFLAAASLGGGVLLLVDHVFYLLSELAVLMVLA